ncbi:nuclear transport factor 2 family protein [Caulobacter sp. DWR1-3-2b1]|uniref:nuclear transport factor 2 family protein n=1 Tax=Caulobacter sp. DWR1-3-2b1 TaxID=2804670 RepID=UPI003CEF3370
MTALADHVLAIQNLKARYCAVADSAASDPDGALRAFGSVFLPDVAADYGFEPTVGAEALGRFLCTAIAGNSEWVLHMIHTPMIEIAGETATGDWTVMAHLKRRETGEVDLVRGRYSDEFRLTPEGWRIARVTFTRLT